MELYENCVGLINVDSPGCRGAKEVGFSTSGIVSDSLKKMVLDHTEQSEVVVKPLGRGSDLSFYGVQIPIQISFDYYQEGENRGRWHCAGCGGGWWWHTAEDNYDKIDYEYLIRDTEIIWDMIEYLRNTKELPFDCMQCMEGIENLIDVYKRQLQYFAAYSAGGFGNLLHRWIMDGMQEEPKEYALKTARAISKFIRPVKDQENI